MSISYQSFLLFILEKMAQSKFNDLASKMGKGGPPGVGLGLKLLGVAGALAYGASQSVFTGKKRNQIKLNFNFSQ